jgi:hypothetical protein
MGNWKTAPVKLRWPFKRSALAVGVSALCAAVSGVQAIEIDTGNTDLKLRWDNQIRYSLGMRGEKINDDFGNSPTYDETEYKFKRGDVMMNRVDLLSEADLVYKEGLFGVRLSGAGWYDAAYSNGRAEGNPDLAAAGIPSNYTGGRYSSTTRRFARGLSGELLDAFVFSNRDFGEGRAFSVKLGKHTVYWGEALFNSFHGIAYSQAPLDGMKASSSPGIEAKEVFMPVNQLSASYSFSPEWSLRGQYFLAWRPNRLPQGGTYFGSADMLFDGPDNFFLGRAGAVPRTASVEPTRNAGNNWGVNLRYSPEKLSGTSFGVYYRRFDETQPWAPVLGVGAAGPSGYHLAYAKDTEMYAVSAQTPVGPVSVGAELSYRKNTALNSAATFAAAGDFAGIEGARGNTFHAVANAVYLLPKTALWESGTLIGELVYSHLDKVTKNANAFKGVGYMGCTTPVSTPGSKDDGCATRNVWLAQVNMTPQWLQVLPSLDLSMPISVGYGIRGNGATLGGGNEGAVTYSVGLEAVYGMKHYFKVQWADQHARYYMTAGGPSSSGNAAQNNHGWLAISYKTTF